MTTRSLALVLFAVAVAPGSPARGDLFVTNAATYQVLRYDNAGNYLGVFAQDNGTVQGLAVGPDGNFYVSNLDHQSVERFSGANGASLGTFIPSGSGGIIYPHDIAFGPGNNLYVASGESESIVEFNGTTGALIGTFATHSGLFPTGFGFSGVLLYVSNFYASQILEFDGKTGAYIGLFASGGPLNGPAAMTFDAKGDLFVANQYGNSVLEYDPSGNLLRTLSAPNLVQPNDAVFGPDGLLYVTGGNSNVIDVFDPTTGAYLRTFASGGPLDQPLHLVFFTPVPEPSSVALLGVGAVAAMAARRRATRHPRPVASR